MTSSYSSLMKAPLSGSILASLFLSLFCGIALIEASISLSSPFRSLASHPSRSGSRFRSLTDCSAPVLSSLDLETIPWYSSQLIDLDLSPSSFDPNVFSYFTTRAGSQSLSFLRVNLGSLNPANAQLTILLNGNTVDPNPIPSLDLRLQAGTNTLQIQLNNGGCRSSYQVLIYEAPLADGENPPPFPDCSTAPNTQVNGFTIGVSASGSSTVVPLIVNPPFDPSLLPFYVAYEGVGNFVGGYLHFTPTFSSGGWFRYSINHGPWIYGSASGQEIVAPLVDGTNLIQFDVIQPGPCGDYIAEYSLTIYTGPPPGELTIGCTPVNELSALTLNLIPWLSNTVMSLNANLQSGVYSYTLSRSASHAILQLSATGPAGVPVNVYLNGVIVQPHPLPSGTTLDLVLAAGTDVITIDLTQGQCTTTYTISITDDGNDNVPCTAPNIQVQIESLSLAIVDAAGNVYPLVITPAWDGVTTYFYVSYDNSNLDLTGAQIQLTINSFTSTAWFRVAFNHGIFVYGNPSQPILSPLLSGTNLIQLDVLQLYSCGDYIAEYSITIYPGPPPGEDIVCPPIALTSFALDFIPWLSSHVIPLVALQDGVYDYTVTRTSSHGIFQLTVAVGSSVEIDVFLNGQIVQPHPFPSGSTLDLIAVAGTDTIKIDLTQGDCTTTYSFTSPDDCHDDHPCPDNSPVQISSVTLSVTDAADHVYPLVLTPTWNGLSSWFYVAYIGDHDVTGGNIQLTITGLSPDAWMATAFNHGNWVFGGHVGVPIIAPLVSGSNLIQLDAYQFYSCGDYIAEYSITIYQGSDPNANNAPP